MPVNQGLLTMLLQECLPIFLATTNGSHPSKLKEAFLIFNMLHMRYSAQSCLSTPAMDCSQQPQEV